MRIPYDPTECEGCRRESASKTAACQRCGGTGNEPKIVTATVYVCAECGSYYGSSTAGDLSKKTTGKIVGPETRTRDHCPYCKTKRHPCRVQILVPIASAKVNP